MSPNRSLRQLQNARSSHQDSFLRALQTHVRRRVQEEHRPRLNVTQVQGASKRQGAEGIEFSPARVVKAVSHRCY